MWGGLSSLPMRRLKSLRHVDLAKLGADAVEAIGDLVRLERKYLNKRVRNTGSGSFEQAARLCYILWP